MTEEKKMTGYPSTDKPWLKYYTEKTVNAKLPECSVYEYMYNQNKNYPDGTAIIYFGRKITFRTLFENIDRTAQSLTAIGVKQGDVVAVAMPNIPEAIYTIYAINKIGAVANLLHPLAGEGELLHYFNETDCKIAIMFDGTYNIVKNVLSKSSLNCVIVATPANSLPFPIKTIYEIKVGKPKLGNKCISWKDFISKGKNVKTVNEKYNNSKVAFILHTGGTTGTPKGVMLSNNNINSIVAQGDAMITDVFGDVRGTRVMVVLPPFIAYSLVSGMLMQLGIGITLVLIPKFEANKQDEYFKKYKISHAYSIPAFWNELTTNPNFKDYDMSHVKVLCSGGDGMSEKVENEINDFLQKHNCPEKLMKGIGCTEMGGAATMSFKDCNPVCSVGVPLPQNICAAFDCETGEEVPFDQEGEICFSGPSLMIGYYNDQDATDEIIKVHKDGKRWIHTGDLGCITKDGIIFVSGRIKRIIMAAGDDGVVTKIFPDRIEKAILTHPQAELCCVVGTDHPVRIHVPKAAIVLKEGEHDEKTVRAEIMDICREKLPDYMLPEEIRFMEEFPRTEARKVDYRKLEEMMSEKA